MIKINLKERQIVKVLDYKTIFEKLEPGSVIKLTKHPRFDINKYPIYLLKVSPYKRSLKSNFTIEAVNMYTGKPWTQGHVTMAGTEFEIIKERKQEEINKIHY